MPATLIRRSISNLPYILPLDVRSSPYVTVARENGVRMLIIYSPNTSSLMSRLNPANWVNPLPEPYPEPLSVKPLKQGCMPPFVVLQRFIRPFRRVERGLSRLLSGASGSPRLIPRNQSFFTIIAVKMTKHSEITRFSKNLLPKRYKYPYYLI